MTVRAAMRGVVTIVLTTGAWCSPRSAIAQDAQSLPPLPPPEPPTSPPAASPSVEIAPTAPSSTIIVAPAPVATPSIAPEPREDLPAPFGARGQFVLSGASALSASHYEYDNSDATGASFEFSPGADYFVARGVSIGIDGDASYAYSQGYDAADLVQSRTTTFAFGPRVGFDLPLGRLMSLYPRFTLGYESISTLQTDAFGANSVTTSQSGAFVKIFVPLLFHPIPRFYFGFGPDLFHDFGAVSGGPTAGGQATTLGASFIVGAYWGGEVAKEEPRPGPAPRGRKFGETGEIVLTSAIQSGVHFTTYAGGDHRSNSIAVSPAIDFFVANHFSVGFGIGAASTRDNAVDLRTQMPSETDSSALSIHGTVGLDLPIVEGLSLYPRAYLGVASQTYDNTVAATLVTENDNVVYGGLEMPLLVHPGPHVFVGFGPEVEHELSRSVTFIDEPGVSSQNRRTTVDGFLVVGGWF